MSISFFKRTRVRPYLHSFPTRRSSDLIVTIHSESKEAVSKQSKGSLSIGTIETLAAFFLPPYMQAYRHDRSEEHTSELQSLTNLVCRLLLEKKKEPQLIESGNRSRKLR